MHALISSIGTAVPEHRVQQSEVKEAAKQIFSERFRELERLLSVFDNGGIETRHFAMPLSWYSAPHDAETRNRIFVDHAVGLSVQAAERCLAGAGVPPEAVDHVIMVTSTGIATPSLDARLLNRLGFRTDMKRTPLWGLGCAGGAAGLARAAEYVTAFPAHRCLLVAVELCSLTFISSDHTKSNLVAASLFADGAAAALVCGKEAAEKADGAARPVIVAAKSHTWPGTLGVMGWNVTNDGLKVLFSKDIPSLILREMPPIAAELMAPAGWSAGDIEHYALHPGGMKVLKAYAESLRLSPEKLSPAAEVLRKYGNMSSCTMLFVLDEIMRLRPRRSERAVGGALGPGFSAELLLMEFVSSGT